MVAQAERQLAASGKALDEVITDIKAGKFGPARDLVAATAALRKALEAVFSERAKLEKIAQSEGRSTGELDLGAARAEIERRMDRLRETYRAKEVPEQSE